MDENAKNNICIYGAREHNLKNFDVCIPRNSLTVITGLSGSGKSSLAFDTIFAEGQRRYIETFSAYARHFLGNRERPDVDKITGLSPVISIEQKTTNKNPRSTVGTQTEIFDYLRLLYARAGEAYSYLSGEKMVKYTEKQLLHLILQNYDTKPIYILAPLIRSRKGHYKELFESLRKKGYLNVRIDGEFQEIVPGMKLDRYKNHDIEVLIDKLIVKDQDSDRLEKSIEIGLKQGEGLILIYDKNEQKNQALQQSTHVPQHRIILQRPGAAYFFVQLAPGGLSALQGAGKNQSNRLQQNHSRRQQIHLRGGYSASG